MARLNNKYTILFLILNPYFLSTTESRNHLQWTDSQIFNVADFGATADGFTDATQGFMDAWDATCKSSSPSPTLLVPQGMSFLLQPISFFGRYCQSNHITFQIDGNILAPSDPHAWNCNGKNCRQWITFDHFEGLFIHGSGTINGRGSKWWEISCENDKTACDRKPLAFVISHSNNVHLHDLKFENSPQKHIIIKSSSWVYVSHLTIGAPKHSPNTDGIHVQQSSNVFIDQTRIGTGDDCISIGDGSSHLNITSISCGPGHGISIGSLGGKGDFNTVEFVYVGNVEFTGTQNGVRIKTWQGGRGYARNIVFENISFHSSNNPIIIDQYYCPHQHCTNQTSAVAISNVMYNGMYGTSNQETGVVFACSTTIQCTNIIMKNIHLESSKNGKEISAYCLSVQGLANSQVYPRVPCLFLDESL